MRAVKGQRATAMPIEGQANNGEALVKPVGGPTSDGKSCRTQIEVRFDSARTLRGLLKAKK